MGCCRGRRSSSLPRARQQTSIICVNCHKSLRAEAKAAITERSAVVRSRGTYSFTAEIKCGCGWVNKIPLTFSKR